MYHEDVEHLRVAVPCSRGKAVRGSVCGSRSENGSEVAVPCSRGKAVRVSKVRIEGARDPQVAVPCSRGRQVRAGNLVSHDQEPPGCSTLLTGETSERTSVSTR